MRFLLPFFQWTDRTWLSAAINGSKWLFPAIEAVHIVALCLLFGAIVLLDLRLFGLAFRNRPVRDLADELAPWTLCSLIIILVTGVLLFASEAMKSYVSLPFRFKMVFLVAAILFHYTIYRQVTTVAIDQEPPWGKLAATVSLVLWFGVGWGGRGIGFF